jgi:mRNA interferase YafQ
MRTIKGTNQYRRDYKRETKGRSRAYVRLLDADLATVLQVLATDGDLEARYKDHALTGWKDVRDCPIRNDLVLLYRKPDQDTLELVRLGSHSELGLA